MSTKSKASRLTEEDIDDIVIMQADEETAWEEPVPVHKTGRTSLALPAVLFARVAFFARLHHAASPADWLRQVIRERLDVEEAALTAVKQDLLRTPNR